MKREMWLAMGMLFGLVACAVEPKDTSDPREPATVVENDELGVSEQAFIGGGGGGGGVDCSSHRFCYCQCRVDHQCDVNPAQCGPLGSCLTSCDHQYPSAAQVCGDTGPQHPRKILDCL